MREAVQEVKHHMLNRLVYLAQSAISYCLAFVAGPLLAQTFALLPPNPDQLGRKHLIWTTHYYAYTASTTAPGIPLRDANGSDLGIVLSEKDWCLSGVEGTVIVSLSGGGQKTYNYSGSKGPVQADCAQFFDKPPPSWVASLNRTTYEVTQHKYGTGAKGLKLVPFRTLAVDPTLIPLRTVLFIPDAVGTALVLPDGTKATHDGYFFAGDTGGGIKGQQVDMFTGVERSRVFKKVAGKGKPQRFSEALVVNSPSLGKQFLLEHAK